MVQVPSTVEGEHLVLYDGVCGLCSRLLQFLLRHDRRAVFSFASLQSQAGQAIVERFGGNPGELTSFYVVEGYRTDHSRILAKSDAALFVASALEWPWKLGAAVRIVPRPIRDRVYDVVARNRYDVFGRLDHCMIPPPDVRRRFVDASSAS
jgi:predicted DCC family thiol-disulfide oxidoreductase YuxK